MAHRAAPLLGQTARTEVVQLGRYCQEEARTAASCWGSVWQMCRLGSGAACVRPWARCARLSWWAGPCWGPFQFFRKLLLAKDGVHESWRNWALSRLVPCWCAVEAKQLLARGQESMRGGGHEKARGKHPSTARCGLRRPESEGCSRVDSKKARKGWFRGH